MGLRGYEMPCEQVYFSMEMLKVLNEMAPKHSSRHQVTKSRLGELRVSEARYEDLLTEADELYPKCLNSLNKLFWSALVTGGE